MKKFIAGVIVGTIISSSIAFAATYVANVANFKVLVNGKEFTSDPPALVVEGRTYLPLRAMGDALGVPVTWNEELRQAEVGDAPVEKSENAASETEIKGSEILTTKDDVSYKENSYILNLGYLLNKDAYKVLEEDEYVFYFYDTSDYSLHPLRTYEYMLEEANFLVTCDNTDLSASFKGDILNFDYRIEATYENDIVIVMFKKLK